jgi:hypothetical protein
VPPVQSSLRNLPISLGGGEELEGAAAPSAAKLLVQASGRIGRNCLINATVVVGKGDAAAAPLGGVAWEPVLAKAFKACADALSECELAPADCLFVRLYRTEAAVLWPDGGLEKMAASWLPGNRIAHVPTACFDMPWSVQILAARN